MTDKFKLTMIELKYKLLRDVSVNLVRVLCLYEHEGKDIQANKEASGPLAAGIIDFVNDFSSMLDEYFEPEVKDMLISVLSHEARCASENFDRYIPKNIQFNRELVNRLTTPPED